MKNFVVQRTIYGTAEIKAETEQEAIEIARGMWVSQWQTEEECLPEDYRIVSDDEPEIAPNRQIAIIWGIEDVQKNRPDLTDEQAFEVLEQVVNKHDADIGISWDTLKAWANELYPKE